MIKCPFCPNINLKLYTSDNSNQGPAICTNCKNTLLYYINDSISDVRIFTPTPNNTIDSFKPFFWLSYTENKSVFYRKNFEIISSFNCILPVTPSNISSFIRRLNNLSAFS